MYPPHTLCYHATLLILHIHFGFSTFDILYSSILTKPYLLWFYVVWISQAPYNMWPTQTVVDGTMININYVKNATLVKLERWLV